MSFDALPPMKYPLHSGALVREDVVKELGLIVIHSQLNTTPFSTDTF